MSEPPVVHDAKDPPPPPTTERRGRLVPGLVLAALLLVAAAAGVRTVAQRLHSGTDAAGFTVADRPAVDSDVRHRQATFTAPCSATAVAGRRPRRAGTSWWSTSGPPGAAPAAPSSQA